MTKTEIGLLKQRIEDYNSCDKALCEAYDLVDGQRERLVDYTNGLDEDSEVYQVIYKDIDEAIDHIYEALNAINDARAAVRFTRSVAESNLQHQE